MRKFSTKFPARKRGGLVCDDPTGPFEAFDARLLCRVAQAVEAGEVPAGLLAELQAKPFAVELRVLCRKETPPGFLCGTS